MRDARSSSVSLRTLRQNSGYAKNGGLPSARDRPGHSGGNMVRMLRGMLLLTALGSAVAISGRAVADKPCAIAVKGDSPVAKACASGGLVDAKRTMRDLVKSGKK